MQQDRKTYFHNDPNSTYFLFSVFPITTPITFFFASILVLSFCWIERFLTFWFENVSFLTGNKIPNYYKSHSLLVKTLGYGIITTLRLVYMLLVMNMNFGIFIVVVTGLTTGQFIVEYFQLTSYSNYQPIKKVTITGLVPSSDSSHILKSDLANAKNSSYKDDIELSNNIVVVPDFPQDL
ncbi:hypothetical protein G9A89_004114 [Geosiphon pyriformis]|nr:hypothetical protein G9A89_004114 [Geosiphon pyriformis]